MSVSLPVKKNTCVGKGHYISGALIFLLCNPGFAYASLKRFAPKLSHYNVDLTADWKYHNSSKDGIEGRKTVDVDKKHREGVKFTSLGYMYHPDFVVFLLDASGHLDHESYMNGDEDSANWITEEGIGEEYQLQGIVLRRKPYNLEFDLSEQRPFETSKYNNSNGLKRIFKFSTRLNYRKTPLGVHLSYNHTRSDRDDSKSLTDSVGTSASFHRASYYLQGTFTHRINRTLNDSSLAGNQADEKTINDDAGLGFMFSHMRYHFNTNVNYTNMDVEQDQKSGDSLLTDNASSKMLTEYIDIDMPWNMSARINMFANRNDNKYRDVVAGNDWAATYNEDQRISARLKHHLFDSVKTTLDADFDNRTTDTNHRQMQKYNAQVDYDKRLRGGGINAVFVNSLIIQAQDGTAHYVDYESAITWNGTDTSYEVRRSNVDWDSFGVESCDVDAAANKGYSCNCYKNRQCSLSVDNQLWQSLSEGTDWSTDHYSYTLLAGSSLTSVTSYQFRATYSQMAGNYTTLSNTSSYTANLHLLDDVFAAHVSHSSTNERFLKGDTGYDSNLPQKVTRNAVGITLDKSPLIFDTYYNWLDSEDFDEKRWLMSLEYASGRGINKFVNLGWGSGYRREESTGKDFNGEDRSGIKKNFHINFSMSGLLPATKLKYLAGTGYSTKRGFIPIYQVDENGLWQSINYHDDDTNNYNNRLIINGVIPYIRFIFSLSGRYSVTKNLTNNLVTKTKNYAITTSRDWIFGATTISLSASYSILDQRGEVGTQYGTDSHNSDNDTEINVHLTRALF